MHIQETIELIFSLLLLMTVLVAVARRTEIPYPIFLVLGGLLISLIPGLPLVELEPQLVFLLFLPPILTSAGYFTPIRDFRANLRPILLLAIGLVFFTILAVALVAHAFIPGLPWAAAFALGAIVAPPDAIAATSIAQRLNLPRRIVTLLEGESLVNDASALVAYRVAVAAALTGAFSLGSTAGDFLLASVGGVVVGLVVGWLTVQILRLIDDTPVEVLITFLASFLVYLAAETLHLSGVLAAVVTGIYLGRHGSRVMSSQTRIEGVAVWQIVVFLLNGLVFILIGLQLPAVLERLAEAPIATLAWYALLISLAVILSRMVWIFPAAYLPRWASAKLRARDPYPPWRFVVIVGWAGMRGIVSLAAALALPEAFPARDLIIFLTFSVILVTLVGQGLSLPWLIRRLAIVEDGTPAHEEAKARWAAAKAGLARLEELVGEAWVEAHHADHLREHYLARAERFRARYQHSEDGTPEQQASAMVQLEYALMDAELEALLKLRDQGVINDEALRRVQRELDLERLRLGVDGDGLH
jgi:CPA1 family monovalent cation:H+ antiporter